MSRLDLDRRRFLTLPLALLLLPAGLGLAGPRPGRAAAAATRAGAFEVEVGLLWRTVRFQLDGTLEERVDHAAGRYEVRAEGRGGQGASRVESQGMLRDGRWAPLRSQGWFQVLGRETRSAVAYDYGRGRIEYHYRGETFFLRRPRVADDVLGLPSGLHVDDAISAVLNYGEGRWPGGADGRLRTHVVRRQRPENEGVDDAGSAYRAELAPVALKVDQAGPPGRLSAAFDLDGFSSWARPGQPARVVFGAHRRPELITAPLILGTSITIRLQG